MRPTKTKPAFSNKGHEITKGKSTMTMKPNLTNKLEKFLMLVLLVLPLAISAQVLNKPEPAPNPNLGGTSPWTAACASDSFNEYFVNFTWGPPLVNSGNTFILELSDENGNFDNPIELATDNTQNTTFDFDFQFSVPTTVRGDNYKFRVRSTDPAVTSPASDAFAMYYVDFNETILISQNGNGTIPAGGTIQVCDGSSVTLAPHNVPNSETYSYNWYRSSTLLSEKGPSLTTNQSGIYYVEIDYGAACSGSANTLSNTIEINSGTSAGIAINPPAKTALCSGETLTLQSNITGMGYTYTWYKNNSTITTPTVDDDSYTIDASVAGFEGDYQVEISGPGICVERSTAVNITNSGDFEVTVNNATNLVLLPGQTKTLSVSTTAASPNYQWYYNGSVISGATNSTLDINQIGDYYVAVTLSGGACSSTTINSETTTVVSPASFEMIIAYNGTYADCTNTSIVLDVATINAVANDGSKTDVTSDLKNSFTYQWKKDGSNVSGETNSSISLVDISENGNYSVSASLGSFNPNSNTLNVLLRVDENITITSTATVSCDSNEMITITTSTDLTSASFEWQKDGVTFNSTDAVLNVNGTGAYQLVVTRNGCPVPSNTINILPFDESIITLDAPENLVIPEGTTRTVRASGGTSYQWVDEQNNVLSDTDAIDVSAEGTISLIAQIDNCTVSKTLTVEYLDTFRVPNVISANGDGINDQWTLPNSYSNKSDVNVIIYNDKGEEVLNEFSYKNDWPSSTTSFPKQNMVFFYTIRNVNGVLKQGTITIIR